MDVLVQFFMGGPDDDEARKLDKVFMAHVPRKGDVIIFGGNSPDDQETWGGQVDTVFWRIFEDGRFTVVVYLEEPEAE